MLRSRGISERSLEKDGGHAAAGNIGVLKAIRKKLNKHDGDTIHVVIEAE